MSRLKLFNDDALYAEILEEAVNNRNSHELVSVGATGPIADRFGPTLPVWIYPLRFEHNLNKAIGLLDRCESLRADLRQTSISFLSLRSMEGLLSNIDDQSYLEFHKEYSSRIDLDLQRKIIAKKHAESIVDLSDYLKAVEVGSRIVFGMSPEGPPLPGDSEDLLAIRNWLRSIINNYRIISKRSHSVVIPISLKWEKNSDETAFLVPGWKTNDNNTRAHSANIESGNELVFDASESYAFSQIKNRSPRLNRIGARTIDFRSSSQEESHAGSARPRFGVTWELSLQDTGPGILLGSHIGSDRYKPVETKFSSTPGSNDVNNVLWNSSASLHGYDPIQEWKIVARNDLNRQGLGNLYDIVLYFDVTYIES